MVIYLSHHSWGESCRLHPQCVCFLLYMVVGGWVSYGLTYNAIRVDPKPYYYMAEYTQVAKCKLYKVELIATKW